MVQEDATRSTPGWPQDELCEKADATQEPTDLESDSFHIEMSRHVHWNKGNTMFIVISDI